MAINQEQITKVQELLKDAAFVEEIAGKETAEEIKAVFQTKGIDISAEEAASLAKVLDQAVAGNGELSEAALDSVAGGFSIFNLFWNVNGNSLLVNLTDRCAQIRLHLLNRRPYQR